MKHIPRKRFGQNFLQDQSIIHKIIQCIAPTKEIPIVEIGPGLGALTKPMIESVGHIDVVEIDRDIIEILHGKYSNKQITVHEGDALKFDFSFAERKIRVVGNLPYNISTPLLFHLSEFSNIVDMTFMLQDEVVKRICADVGTNDYGRLTVMLQYKFKCRKLLDVAPECFYPAPKVNSAIVRLIPRVDYAWREIDEKLLNQVVTAAFNQRRKTINNSLKNVINSEELASLGIDASLRAEKLSVNDYLKIVKFIESKS